MWKDATIQVIFSLGLGIGTLPNLSRYNQFNNNCKRDVFWIVLGDTVASILSGIVVFCFLGYLSQETNENIEDIVCEGPLLTFKILIDGLTRFTNYDGAKHVVIALFALLLLTLGLDCILADIDTIQCAILDNFEEPNTKVQWGFLERFPKLRKKKCKVSICILHFFINNFKIQFHCFQFGCHLEYVVHFSY